MGNAQLGMAKPQRRHIEGRGGSYSGKSRPVFASFIGAIILAVSSHPICSLAPKQTIMRTCLANYAKPTAS